MERSLLVLLVSLFLMTVPVLGQDETFVRWVRFADSWTLDPVMATDAASTEVLVKIYDTLERKQFMGVKEMPAGGGTRGCCHRAPFTKDSAHQWNWVYGRERPLLRGIQVGHSSGVLGPAAASAT